MKKYFVNPLLIIYALVFIFGCSTTQQSSDTEEQVYIFDEVPEEKTIEPPKTGEYPNTGSTYYVVQIGAYSTEDKAKAFADISGAKTNYKSSIVYSQNLNLYLVQIIPFFKSRTEAEEVRNNLWKLPEFVDAWIVTVNK
ncbi:MAG: SPOR domain-containing protein [Ignavibacterium sp.]|jgi:cell division septation protein DedD|nr:SPOR domain-containing protein [Ignavibacterium sp.]